MRQAEGLGGDRLEHRLRPAHVDRAGDDRQLAVGVQAATRGRGLEPSGPPADRDADALAVGQGAAALPQRVRAQALQALGGAEDREGVAVEPLVALAQHVAQAQLDRVEAQLGGQLVDERLDGEGRRRRRRRAIGAEADAIRQDPIGGDVAGLPAIRARGEHGGERLEAELVVAAAVEDDAPAHAGQVALGRRARLELDDLAGRRVGRGEVLDARQGQADGALEAHAGGGRQRLGDHQLAPEGAAQRRRAHAHAVVRPAEQVGQLLARAEGTLRARADHEPALGLQPRGGHLRLHVALVDPARAVAPARPRRPAGQRRLRVADAHALAPGDVVRQLLLVAARVAATGRGVRAADVRAVALDDIHTRPGRARRHRRLEIERCLQRLDVDDDLVDAVGRRGLASRPPPAPRAARSRRPPSAPAAARRAPRRPSTKGRSAAVSTATTPGTSSAAEPSMPRSARAPRPRGPAARAAGRGRGRRRRSASSRGPCPPRRCVAVELRSPCSSSWPWPQSTERASPANGAAAGRPASRRPSAGHASTVRAPMRQVVGDVPLGGSPFPRSRTTRSSPTARCARSWRRAATSSGCACRASTGPSIFGAMLDRDAGSFRLAPVDTSVPAGQRYLPGTMVLETTWGTRTGWVIVRDVLLIGPWHHDDERSHTHRRSPTDNDADHVLLRTMRCVNGRVEMHMECEPRVDYGRKARHLGVRAAPATARRSARAEGEALAADAHHRPAHRLRGRARPRAHDPARRRHRVHRAVVERPRRPRDLRRRLPPPRLHRRLLARVAQPRRVPRPSVAHLPAAQRADAQGADLRADRAR